MYPTCVSSKLCEFIFLIQTDIFNLRDASASKNRSQKRVITRSIENLLALKFFAVPLANCCLFFVENLLALKFVVIPLANCCLFVVCCLLKTCWHWSLLSSRSPTVVCVLFVVCWKPAGTEVCRGPTRQLCTHTGRLFSPNPLQTWLNTMENRMNKFYLWAHSNFSHNLLLSCNPLPE